MLLESAGAILRAGEIETGHEKCREAFQLAQTLQDGRLMAQAALTWGSAFVIAKVDPDLVNSLREALAAMGENDNAKDVGLRARLQARLAAGLQPAPNPAEPMAMAKKALALARSTGDRRTLFETLTSAISALMDFALAQERVDLNMEYARLAEEFNDVPAQFRAHTLLFIDGLEMADARMMEAALDQCARVAQRISLPHYEWRVHSARVLQAMIHGAYDEAERQLALARNAVEQIEDFTAQTTLAIQAFDLLAATGETNRDRIDTARLQMELALQASGAEDLFIKPLVMQVMLKLDDVNSARTACTPGVVDRVLEMGEMCNIQVIGDCAVRLGDRDLAQRVFDRLAPAPPTCGHSGLYGMTWNGPTALTLSRVCTLLDKPKQARDYLEEAYLVAERIGALTLARELKAELSEHGHVSATGEPESFNTHRELELISAGDYWKVTFQGQEATIKDSKGMQILARLIDRPGQEFHALDLNTPGGFAVIESVDDFGLDGPAKAAYRQRLADIAEDLEDARELNDTARLDRLLGEQEALQRELSRAFGLGGRRRPGGTAAERARVNVTRRLRDAIRRIGEQLPAAGRYLDSTVKTGAFCRYEPL